LNADPLCGSERRVEERRRFGGRVLRPEGVGRQGIQLDSTSANKNFEVLFRLYGPEKPLFARTWKLPDIDKAS
jgi:hypothetical protein